MVIECAANEQIAFGKVRYLGKHDFRPRLVERVGLDSYRVHSVCRRCGRKVAGTILSQLQLEKRRLPIPKGLRSWAEVKE